MGFRSRLVAVWIGAMAGLWTPTLQASPPDWDTICASPGPSLAMWAWPRRYASPQEACGGVPCEPHLLRDVGLLSIPDDMPMLLIKAGAWWFAHQGLIAPDESLDGASRQMLSGETPPLERLDLRFSRSEGETKLVREITLLCSTSPDGDLFCIDLPMGWHQEDPEGGKGSTRLELHRCPKGEVAMAGALDHLSDETKQAVERFLGAHPLTFGEGKP